MADWNRKLATSDVSIHNIYNMFLPWHMYKMLRHINIQQVDCLSDFLTLMFVKRENNVFVMRIPDGRPTTVFNIGFYHDFVGIMFSLFCGRLEIYDV